MEERYGVIYKITNILNDKVYIGQTIKRGGFNSRYHGGVEKTHNSHLRRSIEKYGKENFEIDKELYIAYSKDELNNKELEFIKLYKSNDYNYGYNIKVGGDNIGKIEGKNRADILLRQGSCIICRTTYDIFLSLTDASEKYNIGAEQIRKQCNGITNFRKDTFYNKELNKFLEFEYYSHVKKGIRKPVICCNTKEIFKNCKCISEKYDFIIRESIRSALYRSQKYEKNGLEFMYLYHWVIENY